MPVSNVIMQLVFGLSCGLIGFLAGLSLGWREYKFGDRHVAVPTMARTEKQQAFMLVMIGVISVASASFAGIQSARQSDCNREFRESLVARSAISSENQRHIDDVFSAFADAISNPKPDSRDHIQKVILEYQEWSTTAERQRAENPIRDPKCGG